MRLIIGFVLVAVIDAVAALLISKGMKQAGEVSTLELGKVWEIAKRALRSIHLLIGFFLEVINFFLFLILLSWMDLSMVIPVMGSGSYILSIIGAKFFLNEDVTVERWIGTALIAGGVVLVGL